MKHMENVKDKNKDMSQYCEDMTAVISGSRGNLGPIWENALSNAGARVYGFDWDENRKEDIYNADVRRCGSLAYFVHAYNQMEIDPPDIIINNAAIDVPPTHPDINFFTDVKNTIETNLMGAINLTSFFVKRMALKGSGLIINVGSIQGNVAADWRNYEPGFEKPVGYNVSKAGLIQLTRSIAVQYGRSGVRSVCLSFAAVDTGKFVDPFKSKFLNCLPSGRFISPESVEAALRFAITCPELTGTQVMVDSGYTAW